MAADTVKIKKSYDYLLKFLLIGDSSAGKTAILSKYQYLLTPEHLRFVDILYVSTIGRSRLTLLADVQ